MNCRAQSTSPCSGSPSTTTSKARSDGEQLIEQAKGILMARHAIDADKAFEMLRDHSQHNGQKLIDIAQRSSRATPPATGSSRRSIPQWPLGRRRPSTRPAG